MGRKGVSLKFRKKREFRDFSATIIVTEMGFGLFDRTTNTIKFLPMQVRIGRGNDVIMKKTVRHRNDNDLLHFN